MCPVLPALGGEVQLRAARWVSPRRGREAGAARAGGGRLLSADPAARLHAPQRPRGRAGGRGPRLRGGRGRSRACGRGRGRAPHGRPVLVRFPGAGVAARQPAAGHPRPRGDWPGGDRTVGARPGAAAARHGRHAGGPAPLGRDARPPPATVSGRMAGRRGRLARGLGDPAVAAGLASMQEEPARPWTVAELARCGAVSRSTLAVRFKCAWGRRRWTTSRGGASSWTRNDSSWAATPSRSSPARSGTAPRVP